MDIQWMKHVDRYAGIPLCGALRLYDLARGGRDQGPGLELSPEPVRLSSPNPKIAVIKFWGMGSLILAAPVFSALRKTHPAAELHLITLRQNRAIAELLGLADQVHFLELPRALPGLSAGILALFREVSALKPDAVIDLEYLSRFSAIASYLSGSPVRVGFHSWDVWRGNLHTVRRAFNPYWHATENFLNLARALGGEASLPDPVRIKLTGAEDEEAGRLLAAAGVGHDERLIAVNANASTMALARRWPEQSFVALIDRLLVSGLGRVVLLGAGEETAYVNRVQSETRAPDQLVNLAGKSTLTGLVGILRRTALLVTNDSGPLHLADALGARTLSFFGPETPLLFGPRGQGHVVLYRGIDCSPCINIYNAKTVHCMRPEPECLSGISVDEAWAALHQALGETR